MRYCHKALIFDSRLLSSKCHSCSVSTGQLQKFFPAGIVIWVYAKIKALSFQWLQCIGPEAGVQAPDPFFARQPSLYIKFFFVEAQCGRPCGLYSYKAVDFDIVQS